MKRYINALILMLAAVCLIGAIKLSSLPLFPSFSEQSFWYTSAVERESFLLLYDLFVGFLLSALFYFLVEVIPEALKLRLGRKLICKYINSLLVNMEKILSVCFQVYKIDTTEPYPKDLIKLQGSVAYADTELSYQTTIFYNTGKRKTGFHEFGKFDDIIKTCIAEVEKQLQNTKRFGSFYASDERLLEVTTRIETCKFISEYKKDRKHPVPCFTFSDADKAVFEFYQLYSKLKKLKVHTEYSKTTVDSPEEYKRYKRKRESGEIFTSVVAYQQARSLAYIEEHPIVLCGDRNADCNIISEIEKTIPDIKVFDRNSFCPSCLENSHLIILLTDISTFGLDLEELHQKTFCLCGRVLPPQFFRIFKQTGNSRKIYYKKSFSFFGINFNAEHPTPEDIHILTSEIDKYVQEKHSLKLQI